VNTNSNPQSAAITAAADRGAFLPSSIGYRECADINGTEARRFLESAGFVVVSNRDTGRNGEAVTACGIALSTNGYCHRLAAAVLS
jgi:hypothetical protein